MNAQVQLIRYRERRLAYARPLRQRMQQALAPSAASVSPVFAIQPLSKETKLFSWALLFLVVALIAGIFGFGGIAAASAGIAKIVFIVALIALAISVVGRALK